MREVFKTEDEIYVLSWNFGIQMVESIICYSYCSRAFLLSNRPVLALFDGFPARYNTLQLFEENADMSILQMRFEMVFKIFITFLTVVCYHHKIQFSAVGIEISCLRKKDRGR